MSTLIGIDKQVFSPPELGCSLYLPGFPGGSNKIYDRSPYGNIGTITGATWARLPSGLWYLSFDGDDRVIMPADILPANDFTIATWFKTSSAVGNPMLIKFSDDFYAGLWVQAADSKLRFYADIGAAGYDVFSDNVVTDNVWHYVAVTKSSTAGMKMYIAGVLQADVDATATGDCNAQNGYNTLGAYNYDKAPGSWEQYLTGSLALSEVVRSVLSALEIQNHFDREKHLFGVWSF